MKLRQTFVRGVGLSSNYKRWRAPLDPRVSEWTYVLGSSGRRRMIASRQVDSLGSSMAPEYSNPRLRVFGVPARFWLQPVRYFLEAWR